MEDKVIGITSLVFPKWKDFFTFKEGGTMRVGEQDQIEGLMVKIKDMLDAMKYGSITLVVQDGKVIQLEKNEKVRLR